jgi:hypothetical protein
LAENSAACGLGRPRTALAGRGFTLRRAAAGLCRAAALSRARRRPALRGARRARIRHEIGTRRRHEARFDLDAHDRTLDQLLDVAQIAHLLIIDQGERGARRAGAPGAADAVHVVFRHVGQLEVDHLR